MQRLLEILRECGVGYDTDVSAKALTCFGGGGSVRTLVYPDSEDKLVSVVKRLTEEGFDPFVLGSGSDTVIADGIIERPVISTLNMDGIDFSHGSADEYGVCVKVQSGVRMSTLISAARAANLGGLEFLQGVPCSVGGAIKMNAGAFGCQTGDFVSEVTVLNKNCRVENINPDFDYRKGAEGIIISAIFRLPYADKELSADKSAAYLRQRSFKQPQFPSCGSVFKNGEIPSGLLIERCGLKGVRCGGAEISPQHANFIVNRGGATARDFINLVELAEGVVLHECGVALEREFVYLR